MNQTNLKTSSNKPVKTAITPTREDNFPEWYQEVIKAADLAENAPVRGCMTIKPYGFQLWDNIKNALDDMIKREGVQNAYFPLLIPLEYIAKEADHIDGFATECAVVTHHRLEKNAEGKLAPSPAAELTEPYIIRPTSETIIGHTVKNWIQSYRDLPMKLNQWCNVMRWEMRTRLFLRTSEFLWQEGHNIFEKEEEARKDMETMLECYASIFEDWLAMPVIRGWKTEDELFPGAVATMTVESMMQDGKALQAATSHFLGQTFTKAFDVTYQTREGDVKHAWTTSWGLSTRSIGGLIMTHGDDDGIKMPPKIAPTQIVILPFLKGERDSEILGYCEELKDKLNANGMRAHVDTRDMRAGDKSWDWIKKGVPLRVEIGAREMDADQVTHTRRDIGKDSKTTVSCEEFEAQAQSILDDIQKRLFNTAKHDLVNHIAEVETVEEAHQFFADGRKGFVKLDKSFWNTKEFNAICDEFAVTPRCIPFDDPDKVIIGKSY